MPNPAVPRRRPRLGAAASLCGGTLLLHLALLDAVAGAAPEPVLLPVGNAPQVTVRALPPAAPAQMQGPRALPQLPPMQQPVLPPEAGRSAKTEARPPRPARGAAMSGELPPSDAAPAPQATPNAPVAMTSADQADVQADTGALDSGAMDRAEPTLMAAASAGVGSTTPAAEPSRLAAADVRPAAASGPAGGAAPPPTYPTRVPAAASLRFSLQRGVISGSAELEWAPAAGRYELKLAGSVFGAEVMDWQSSGLLDAHGLAPVRFADKRRGRERQVANFQRQAGIITFSGPQAQYPLVAGAQDRLSFMLQLAAIVNADPARYRPGSRIQMFVAGARGDGSVWTFVVGDRETLDLPSGRVEQAVSLRRVTRAEHDTQSEVWLDPARQHLPVRLVMSSGSQMLELALR